MWMCWLKYLVSAASMWYCNFFEIKNLFDYSSISMHSHRGQMGTRKTDDKFIFLSRDEHIMYILFVFGKFYYFAVHSSIDFI